MPSVDVLLHTETQLVDMIGKLSVSLRELTQAANYLQGLGLAKHHDCKEVIENSDELNEILEVLIKELKCQVCNRVYFRAGDEGAIKLKKESTDVSTKIDAGVCSNEKKNNGC